MNIRVCNMIQLHLHLYSLAGKSRWTSDIRKCWSAVGCIWRQGDTFWWDIPGLQKLAPVLGDYLLVQSSYAVCRTREVLYSNMTEHIHNGTAVGENFVTPVYHHKLAATFCIKIVLYILKSSKIELLLFASHFLSLKRLKYLVIPFPVY